MKYLFINSVAGYGSTGRIAAEQCRELMKQGHHCVLAYGRYDQGYEDIPKYRIGSDWDCKLHALQSRILDTSGFGSRKATLRFLKWVREYDPDVIWLHNLHGYYLHVGELFRYLRGCGKEIHWTLHDCWAFTGHCAYFDYAGCEKWKTRCMQCPEKAAYPKSILRDGSRENFQAKKRLFRGIPNLSLRVPSYWLQKRVAQSFLRDYPIEVVYNRVNPEVFHPTPGDFRETHGLTEKKLLLGVANVWDRRKGFADFLELERLLGEDYRIVLVGLDAQQLQSLPEKILGLPRTGSPQELAQLYTTADYYICPSVEETFGMTVLEAQSCGTRAIVYRDTACQEIAERFGGLAVERGAAHIWQAICQQEGIS